MGADPNIQDRYTGATPLHLAIRKGNIEIVKHLLKSGAVPTIPDKKNVTPLQLAKQKGFTDIVNFIEQISTLSTIPMLENLKIYNRLDLDHVSDLHEYLSGPPPKGGRGKRRKTLQKKRKSMKRRKTNKKRK
jgi:ankyrin repeat protein